MIGSLSTVWLLTLGLPWWQSSPARRLTLMAWQHAFIALPLIVRISLQWHHKHSDIWLWNIGKNNKCTTVQLVIWLIWFIMNYHVWVWIATAATKLWLYPQKLSPAILHDTLAASLLKAQILHKIPERLCCRNGGLWSVASQAPNLSWQQHGNSYYKTENLKDEHDNKLSRHSKPTEGDCGKPSNTLHSRWLLEKLCSHIGCRVARLHTPKLNGIWPPAGRRVRLRIHSEPWHIMQAELISYLQSTMFNVNIHRKQNRNQSNMESTVMTISKLPPSKAQATCHLERLNRLQQVFQLCVLRASNPPFRHAQPFASTNAGCSLACQSHLFPAALQDRNMISKQLPAQQTAVLQHALCLVWCEAANVHLVAIFLQTPKSQIHSNSNSTFSKLVLDSFGCFGVQKPNSTTVAQNHLGPQQAPSIGWCSHKDLRPFNNIANETITFRKRKASSNFWELLLQSCNGLGIICEDRAPTSIRRRGSILGSWGLDGQLALVRNRCYSMFGIKPAQQAPPLWCMRWICKPLLANIRGHRQDFLTPLSKNFAQLHSGLGFSIISSGIWLGHKLDAAILGLAMSCFPFLQEHVANWLCGQLDCIQITGNPKRWHAKVNGSSLQRTIIQRAVEQDCLLPTLQINCNTKGQTSLRLKLSKAKHL